MMCLNMCQEDLSDHEKFSDAACYLRLQFAEKITARP